MVQMNSLARNFAMKFGLDTPAEFGQTFSYTKVFLGKFNGEFVNLENYLNGTFQKYIKKLVTSLVTEAKAWKLKYL